MYSPPQQIDRKILKNLFKHTELYSVCNFIKKIMASQRLMTYTKLAIAEFVETYGDLKEKKGFEGPSADELFEMMSQEILGKSYDPNSEAKYEQFIESGKNLREDEEETTESVCEVESVESTVEVEESKSVAKENPKKINAKDLKNFTVKENKQGKNGEMKEGDVMIELPYLPHCVDYSGTCQAIKFNGGLMTPCLTRPAKGSSYCRSCVKELKYGTLESRNNVEIGSYQVTCENEDGKNENRFGSRLTEYCKCKPSFVV